MIDLGRELIRSIISVGQNVAKCISYCPHTFRLFVRNIDIELLFQFHDQFNNID